MGRLSLRDATPIFHKLFANFDAFFRVRGTCGRHSGLLICANASIFVSLSSYSCISFQGHQNFARAPTFLARMAESSKMGTCFTLEKFCENWGPFSCRDSAGPVNFHEKSSFFKKFQENSKGSGVPTGWNPSKFLRNPSNFFEFLHPSQPGVGRS